ncbi:hypothetical protein L1887_59633 [Cichorium endivia]|nr:hypothetical protein L1887_59633 [Cichorium endivia]
MTGVGCLGSRADPGRPPRRWRAACRCAGRHGSASRRAAPAQSNRSASSRICRSWRSDEAGSTSERVKPGSVEIVVGGAEERGSTSLNVRSEDGWRRAAAPNFRLGACHGANHASLSRRKGEHVSEVGIADPFLCRLPFFSPRLHRAAAQRKASCEKKSDLLDRARVPQPNELEIAPLAMKPNFFLLDRSAQISGFRSFARVAEAELSGPAALWGCTSEHHHNPVRIHHGLFIDTQTSAIDGTGATKRCDASGAAAGDPARELDHRDRHGGLGQVDFHREPARSPARKGAGATRCHGPRA